MLKGLKIIYMPRQVEMANEQKFIHFGRMVQIGLFGTGEPTKLILRE